MDGRKFSPVFYRTSSPSEPLPKKQASKQSSEQASKQAGKRASKQEKGVFYSNVIATSIITLIFVKPLKDPITAKKKADEVPH